MTYPAEQVMVELRRIAADQGVNLDVTDRFQEFWAVVLILTVVGIALVDPIIGMLRRS